MTKLTLKQMILNKIDNSPRGYAETLATISESYSSGSNLKKVLKNEEKEFDQFKSLIKIVNYIWGNDTITMMVKYSSELDPRKKASRSMLEFLAMNREFNAMLCLIERMENCPNRESMEWARMYKILYSYEIASKYEEFNLIMREVSSVCVTFNELKAFKTMLLTYCFNQMENHNMVRALSEEVERESRSIENDYIKEMYEIRRNQIMSYFYLRVLNNPIAARECAEEVLISDATVSFKAYANYIKGYSYLFESFDKTEEYLNKSIETYALLGRTNDIRVIKEKLEFAKVYWKKFKGEVCIFTVNQALFNAQKGKDIELLLPSVDETEMKLYFVGILTKNEKKLMLSLIKFTKKNDLFLANLAKIELLKLGYDAEIINELIGDGVA